MLSLTSIHCLISSNFKRALKILLFLRGFDPYSPLCYSIRDNFRKLVILELFLTRIGVKLMTASIRSVTPLEKQGEEEGRDQVN